MPFISSFGGNYSSIGRGGPKFNNIIGGTTTEVSNYLGTSETWRIHEITSNIDVQVISGINPFRILLFGGGGGKGSTDGNAGGGGGGGHIEFDEYVISSGIYPVIVGLAGNDDQNGGNTAAFGLTALGGGFGGRSIGGVAYNGGSGGCGGGGGGGRSSNSCAGIGGGSGSQGGNGGNGNCDGGTLVGGGGGGGGAGGNGTNGSPAGNGGAGGPGKSFDITGSAVIAGSGGKGGQGPAGGNSWNGRNGAIIIAYRIR